MCEINGERLLSRIQTLGRIGFQDKTGTTRLSYSPEYQEGRRLVEGWMREAGLQTQVDPVGNLTGRTPGKGPRLCIGSHLDTVPGGGMYDGAYGVLAGIECVQSLKEAGYASRRPLEVVGFIEEEGNVIGGTFGSKAFAGVPVDAAMEPNMAQHGLTPEQVSASRRRGQDYRCYLELHIEQGGTLEQEGLQIGIAHGIMGILRYRMRVEGFANHAGSTAMSLRDDALVKTCRMIPWLMDRVTETSPELVCTVGTLQVFPGAVNVIPGRVEFIVELRGPRMEVMDRLIQAFFQQFQAQGLTGEEYIRQSPTLCSPALIEESRRLCQALNFSSRDMFSGAGHDLINMAQITPSMLLFIPSRKGISHSIQEYSAPADLVRGARLLLELVKTLDQKEGAL